MAKGNLNFIECLTAKSLRFDSIPEELKPEQQAKRKIFSITGKSMNEASDRNMNTSTSPKDQSK